MYILIDIPNCFDKNCQNYTKYNFDALLHPILMCIYIVKMLYFRNIKFYLFVIIQLHSNNICAKQ